MFKKNDNNDVFFKVDQEDFVSSSGIIKLPILYYDVNLLIVFYLVPIEKIKNILEHTDLEPIVLFKNKGLVVLALFEYKDTSVGVYNEVGIAIGVKEKYKNVTSPILELLKLGLKWDPKKISIGFYVVHLPVTTNIANVAGREIWGYPKFVTDIPLNFDFQQKYFYGSVLDPDTKQKIFELSGKLKSAFAIPAFDIITYTYLEEKLIRTIINVAGNFKVSFNKDFKLQQINAKHPMSETLRNLDLDNKNSFLVMYSENWQSRLNKGSVVESNIIIKEKNKIQV